MIKYIACFILFLTFNKAYTQQEKQIVVETKNTSLIFTISATQKVYQSYFGERLIDPADQRLLVSTRKETYIGARMGDLFEPAIRMVHHNKLVI